MMKSKTDEEDYWNSSKFKAFTFDDEDDEFSRVRSEPGPAPVTVLGRSHCGEFRAIMCLCDVS